MLMHVPAPGEAGESKLAVVADVGRRAVRLGLTDHDGRLRPETIQCFEPSQQSTISGALSAFGQSCELHMLPRRCAIAVAGAPVGDVISVTNSRWFVSRSGLTAMLQAPPLILNDFAAKAWALGSAGSGARVEAVGGPGLDPATTGKRCVIGVGSGLGVAVIVRAPGGALNILPTEAGHCHFMAGFPELETVLARIKRSRDALTAEDLISERGLIALYGAVVEVSGASARSHDVETIVRLATTGQDGCAVRAAELFCRALWYFAGNLALAYGAWDGVMLTGGIVQALRPMLRQAMLADQFVIACPHQRQLRGVPRALVELEHGELRGAAQALLLQAA
jgi:glucokinase